MPALHVHRSERTEDLVEALAERYRDAGGDVFTPPWIVVPGRGMGVWLGRELSRRLGVFVSDGLLYPDAFLRRVMELSLGRAPEALERYQRARLPWAVLAGMRSIVVDDDPSQAPLRRYLEAADPSPLATGVGSLQLAERLGEVFDRYLLYRPDLLRAWSAGDATGAEDAPWQPALWRWLEADLGCDHIAALEAEFLSTPPELGPGAPPAIFVFGFGVLPPLYLRVLAHLSTVHDVSWFWPAPSRGYYADDLSPRKRAELTRRGLDPDALGFGEGHPLLASLGRLGADQQRLYQETLEAMQVPLQEHEPNPSPPGPSCLSRLQRDLRQALASDDWEDADPHDGSLRLHVCHGPHREVEVLQDQLLQLLSEGEVEPHEVVVMCPDLETYGPLIEGVFDRPPDDPRYIPYGLADRSLRTESSAIDAFFRVLSLAGSRLRASELLDLLSLEAVRQRFGVGADELEQLRQWTVESGVRWGRDAAHRAEHGQPEDHRNTWRFGLERLLLGYALPTEGRALFGGRLPYDELEGRDAVLLGKLALFVEQVFTVVERLQVAHRPADWRAELVAVVDALLDDRDPHGAAIAQLQRGVADWVEAAGDTDVELGVEAVAASLEGWVERQGVARGYLSQGVTFCAMVPMRAIPFEVVCLLGMNDGSFPRLATAPSFDLCARHPRAGDRARRDDDRYLFLEAIVSARRALWVSYVGRNPRNDEILPPATVVEELFDVVAAQVDPEEPAVARQAMTLHHHLHPFHPSYFDAVDPRRFSFDDAQRDAAIALIGAKRRPERPFVQLLSSHREVERLGLEELVRFFQTPVRYLFEHQLGVQLREERWDVPDRDSVGLDHLESHQLGQVLLDLRLANTPIEALPELARARGELPPGTGGQRDLETLLRSVEPLRERTLSLRGDAMTPRRESGEVRLPGGTIVTGEVETWGEAVVGAQYAKVSGKQLVGLWLRHLWLNALRPRSSHLVGRPDRRYQTEADGAVVSPSHAYDLGPVGEPLARLEELVELYRLGQREPLLLFPRAGFALVRKQEEDVGKVKALWRDTVQSRDPHVAWVFPGDGALNDDAQPFGHPRQGPSFRETAYRVFGPLVSVLEVKG